MAGKNMVWVAAAADATDPNGFGGLPYHLVEAGKSAGLIKGGFPFQTAGKKMRFCRTIWNAKMLIRTGKYGGFQYSESFLRQMWASAPRSEETVTILNMFQLYSEAEMKRPSCKLFYLDQTLDDVFEYYGTSTSMPESWKADVIERERAQYLAAEKVIFRSRWAADRAKSVYGLPDDKVHVVLPGANIAPAVLKAFDIEKPSRKGEASALKVVFVGKEWKRKGLDRLLRAIRIAMADGARIELTVVGLQKEDLPEDITRGLPVTWIGFFDKSSDPQGFIRLLARHDLGVFLSRKEAGGVSLREFGRLGLPVIAPDTGGSPEFAGKKTAILFTPDDTDEKIALELVALAADRDRLNALKTLAWDRRHQFDWQQAVVKLSALL